MSPGSVLRVAVAQIPTVLGDFDANLDLHLRYIERARRADVDCLLFPELSLTGHSAGPETLELARHRDDPAIAELAAASGPMCTLFGLIEEGPAAQFYNAVFAVKDSELAFLHRKVNLATYGRLDDAKHFATGRYVETFVLDSFWRAGVLICNDVFNPALVHLAATQGATVLFVPSSSALEAVGAAFDNPGGWDLSCRFYASMYGFPVIFANRVGDENDLHFWGGSRIVGPNGKALAFLETAEDLLVASIDQDSVRQARILLPTVRDSNLSLITREMNRLQSILGIPESVRQL
ncbi:MAG: nitrilase-related carbon-nitrogen hydrolase [Alphaproteobacteria bacterium]